MNREFVLGADAGWAALVGACTGVYNWFMSNVPLNGGNAMKPENFILPESVMGWRQVGLLLRALGSFSVWPFHGALLALLAMFCLYPPHFPEMDARAGGASAAYPNQSSIGGDAEFRMVPGVNHETKARRQKPASACLVHSISHGIWLR